MAKSVDVWCGNTSYGNSVEVAKREDGVFFHRERIKSSFGTSWSRWMQYNDVSHPTHLVNQLDSCPVDEKLIPLDPKEQYDYIEYGFNILVRCTGSIPYRLPNP